MAAIKDFYWTSDGDFALGPNGDFRDTDREHERGRIQKILTIVAASRGDWKHQPNMGASLLRFRGEPNNASTATRMVQTLYNELVASNVAQASELFVDAVPVGPERVALVVVLTPTGSSKSIVLGFTHDMRDNKIVPR